MFCSKIGQDDSISGGCLPNNKYSLIFQFSWNYFPHDHARSRAYRWGEDSILGITDRQCRLCLGLALWNGKDTIIKERLYGLTGPQVHKVFHNDAWHIEYLALHISWLPGL